MGRQAIRTLTSPTAVTIHSVFDSTGRRIAEYNQATGALIREYVWNGWEPVAVIEGGTVYLVRTDHIGRPRHFSLMQKCFRTGASIFHVPENPASTTKPSPGRRVTGVPPSGVMVIWPSIRWTNS
jgi:hypothetical protein